MGAWKRRCPAHARVLPEGRRAPLRRPPRARQPRREGYPAAHRPEQERIVLTALTT